MDTEYTIQVEGVNKVYRLYEKPVDRLKEALYPGRRKYHRDFHALENISFNVARGETIGIIGRNGAGKSTLLKILAGVLTPTDGRSTVTGRVSSLLELGAGFNPELSGMENIYLQGTLMGFSHAEMESRIPSILEFADIGAFINQPVKQYSSGMFVRLAFACAINVDPDILIVDEALAVGDVRFQVKCHRKLESFRENNKTILLVSHSGSDVVRLCSRAIWLDDGKIRREGPAKRVVEEYSAWMVHDTGLMKQPSAQEETRKDDGNSSPQDGLVSIPANALVTGDGGAVIEACGLFDDSNRIITVLTGPTHVTLKLRVRTSGRLAVPYFGFQIVNAKGLRLMGSNTAVLRMSIPTIEASSTVQVEFSFVFPEISNGSYLVALGVADGTSDNHIRHQYIADAYEFQFASSSSLQKQDVMLKLTDCKVNLSPASQDKGN